MNLSDLVYIDSTGYHYADYPTILEWLKDEYRAVFGADVYLEADSQDGQELAVRARAMYDSAVLGASVYNSFSPATAQGVGLASVVKINGVKKRIATKSTVDLDLAGAVGTVIGTVSQPAMAEDQVGNKWVLPVTTIPISGNTTVTATAEKAGAINAQAGTITKIFTPTRGWVSVTNPLAATPGTAVESDAELRVRQSVSTALPSLSVFEGTIGAVANVTGVTRFKGYENDSDVTDGDGIPAHSISMVVEGGDAAEIAEAIATKKTPGTKTYGTTSEVVYDRYGMPNTINFYRPTIVPITVEVELEAFTGYSAAYADLIKAAVAASINALAIGQDVLITKLYVPANLPGTTPGTTFDIATIKIKRGADPLAAANVVIAFNEAASCVVTDITVTVLP
jgi:uncharacterized phage protein gp47/JayE